jgi:UDP-N-acetylmuramoyl-tripeptide--D-alanyl-D-alanine ligase
VPLTILRLTEEHEAVVVEMAMRARGEIQKLAEIAHPTMAVITNISQMHLETFGSIENIAKAKAELVEFISENGVAVLNGDNHHVKEMKNQAKARTVFYGLSSNQFFRAENIFSDSVHIQTTFVCHSEHGSFSVIIPTLGIHNVYNALAAISACWEIGLSPLEIQAGLLNFEPADMRQTIIRKNHYTLINDAYNANPTSMAAAVNTLREVAKGRKIAVLGDMLELGQEAVAAHEELGELLAQNGLDALITVGKLSVHIADKAREKGVPFVSVCQNHSKAAEELEHFIEPGDTILFKGSRSMEMEKVLELLNF